jgi:hypothetical protein
MFDRVCFIILLVSTASLSFRSRSTENWSRRVVSLHGYHIISQLSNVLGKYLSLVTAGLQESSTLYRFSKSRPQTGAMLISCPTQHHKHLVCSRANLGRTLDTTGICLQSPVSTRRALYKSATMLVELAIQNFTTRTHRIASHPSRHVTQCRKAFRSSGRGSEY